MRVTSEPSPCARCSASARTAPPGGPEVPRLGRGRGRLGARGAERRGAHSLPRTGVPAGRPGVCAAPPGPAQGLQELWRPVGLGGPGVVAGVGARGRGVKRGRSSRTARRFCACAAAAASALGNPGLFSVVALAPSRLLKAASVSVRAGPALVSVSRLPLSRLARRLLSRPDWSWSAPAASASPDFPGALAQPVQTPSLWARRRSPCVDASGEADVSSLTVPVSSERPPCAAAEAADAALLNITGPGLLSAEVGPPSPRSAVAGRGPDAPETPGAGLSCRADCAPARWARHPGAKRPCEVGGEARAQQGWSDKHASCVFVAFLKEASAIVRISWLRSFAKLQHSSALFRRFPKVCAWSRLFLGYLCAPQPHPRPLALM
ncbi:uncharacterized protein [Equus asinus]|uniref:uncharacterized protein n=1 Tax=Equus asinus TaxID=9793 RepID=UPI0038F70AED